MRALTDREAERALIARCKAGDQEAWREVVRCWGPVLARFLHRLGVPAVEHDEVAQEVLVRMFESLPGFREDARLSTWMYRIAANVTWKRRRSQRRRQGVLDRFAAALGRTVPAPTVDQRDRIEARSELRQLETILEQLRPKLRVVWVMVELEQLSPLDVANALDLRPGTVRSRLHEARRQVIGHLTPPSADVRRKLRVVSNRKQGGTR